VLAVTTYLFFKFLHVLLAIVAVGSNATYGVLLSRAAKEPEHLAHVLASVRFIDRRIANPAYGLLLVTGLTMVWLGDLSLTQFWLATALSLYVLAIVLGIVLYAPVVRAQAKALEEGGPASAEYRRLSARGSLLGAIVGVDVVVIAFLMVTKPTI
jgi:uncharacterized membrane protein